jgi:hypothetical protein
MKNERDLVADVAERLAADSGMTVAEFKKKADMRARELAGQDPRSLEAMHRRRRTAKQA